MNYKLILFTFSHISHIKKYKINFLYIKNGIDSSKNILIINKD